MARFSEVCVLVCVLFTPCCLAEVINVTIGCYPNNTITVTNPSPSTLFYGVGIGPNKINCDATFSADNSLITLEGCPKDVDILLQLTQDIQDQFIVGGTGKVQFHIKCTEIVNGMTVNVTHSLQTILVVDETLEQDVWFYPNFYVRRNVLTEPVTIAEITDPLYLTYDLNNNYSMTFDSCTAYSGQTPSPTSIYLQLISSDCSLDTVLIDSFEAGKTANVGDEVRYFTQMRMFRFWDDFYVTIVCQVTICRKNLASCVMNTCTQGGRKRRSFEEGDEVQHSTVWNTLRIVDKAGVDFLPNSAREHAALSVVCEAILVLIVGFVLDRFFVH